jgi:hypothetical protein
MADIKVKTNSNQITVRVGQQNAIKVVAANSSAATLSLEKLENVNDIDTTNRSNNTLIMWDSLTETYKHVDPAQILDLADNIDNESIDYGSF